MRDSEPMTHPPRWTRTLVEYVLPSDPMRDAILGDLHEEFMHDVRDLDVRRACARHVRRAAGIVTRALLDAAVCRNWASTAAAAGHEPGHQRVHKVDEVPAVRHPGPRSSRGLAGDAAFAVLALIVVVVGVVVNTMLFSAAASGSARATAAASTGGVAVLVASVVVAATVLCVGPRWRRKRLGGVANPVNS